LILRQAEKSFQLLKACDVAYAESGETMGRRRALVGPGLYIPSGFNEV